MLFIELKYTKAISSSVSYKLSLPPRYVGDNFVVKRILEEHPGKDVISILKLIF